MDCQVNFGVVTQVQNFRGRQELLVELNDSLEKAYNFPELTGACTVGDQVIVNTTAVALSLGTGGYHFVMGIVNRTRELAEGEGHIMKLRYTPNQGRVLSVEEPDSPHHQIIKEADNIDGLPVIVGTLHSMLAPVCLGLKQFDSNKKLVYLMSDGASLPVGLSKQVESLQDLGLLGETITFNHAFGGDLEAVNVFSALLAAKYVCHADLAIILMGPGVVGTNTKWGTTALEQGVFLNAVHSLQGTALAIPRISYADQRQRHQGISHHTITGLKHVANFNCHIPIPLALKSDPIIQKQLADLSRHKIHWVDTEKYASALYTEQLELRSMGRTPKDDPFFFESALAAGLFAAQL